MMEDRLIKVEVIQEQHTEDIKQLKKTTVTLVDNLKAIKNWVIGGVAIAVMQELGLIAFFKAIFLR